MEWRVAIVKWFLRGACILIIVTCSVLGFYLVTDYQHSAEDVGVMMVRLLYEYDEISDVYSRSDSVRKLCTEDIWDELSPNNQAHFEGTWGRTGNAPVKVRIVWSRPGVVVYALESSMSKTVELHSFVYELDGGLFSYVREYSLVSVKKDAGGGLF